MACRLAGNADHMHIVVDGILRRFFRRVIPFHCASVPHLAWVDESLAYYEAFFGVPILRYMHERALHAIAMLVWQPPGSEADIDAMELPDFTKADICEDIREREGCPRAWAAFAISAYDAIERKAKVQDHAGRNDKGRTFNPCFDWTKKQIVASVKAAGLALPSDYLMAARTLSAVPGYRNILRMKQVRPDDWARVLTVYPMIEAELARQEFRRIRTLRNQCHPPAECSEPGAGDSPAFSALRGTTEQESCPDAH
jgi:hypothetical protein